MLLEASLAGAYLRGANLKGADLLNADLEEADLGGADLSTSRGLTQSQIDSAFGDKNTTLPPGITRPAHWLDDDDDGEDAPDE